MNSACELELLGGLEEEEIVGIISVRDLITYYAKPRPSESET